MRAVSFVSRLEFEFKGNFSRYAICLGDVDNDGDNELAVGNLQGDLAVFKGEECKPWAEAHDLKMIMVVIVGDILNEGKNFTVCISGEGMCNIFDMDVMMSENERLNWKPFHSQQLPANTKVALLADVDGDGEMELVLGLTDHVLRTYRWVKISQTSGEITGKLVGLHKWEFADQIGSISLNPCAEGCPYVLVAQPGGTYISFECTLQLLHDVTDRDAVSKLTPKDHPLASSRMRNRNISTEILGGISGTRNGKKTNSLIAVATLDGTLMLVDNDEILWSLQVDHQLFALAKLDLIGDGEDQVIACAWDGQTYMVNQQRQSVRFQFDEPVCAFTSGMYSVSPGQSISSLVYVTFSDSIHLYYNVQLPSFRIDTLMEKMDQVPETTELISKFPIDREDSRQLRNFYSFCLYGLPLSISDNEIEACTEKTEEVIHDTSDT